MKHRFAPNFLLHSLCLYAHHVERSHGDGEMPWTPEVFGRKRRYHVQREGRAVRSYFFFCLAPGFARICQVAVLTAVSLLWSHFKRETRSRNPWRPPVSAGIRRPAVPDVCWCSAHRRPKSVVTRSPPGNARRNGTATSWNSATMEAPRHVQGARRIKWMARWRPVVNFYHITGFLVIVGLQRFWIVS